MSRGTDLPVLHELVPARARGPAVRGGVADRDARLARDGWTRKFVGGPPRLDEMVALYESLGWQVRLEPLGNEDLSHECDGCSLALAHFRIVYTRSAP